MENVGYFLNQLFNYITEYIWNYVRHYDILEDLHFTMIGASQMVWEFGVRHGALPWSGGQWTPG